MKQFSLVDTYHTQLTTIFISNLIIFIVNLLSHDPMGKPLGCGLGHLPKFSPLRGLVAKLQDSGDGHLGQ